MLKRLSLSVALISCLPQDPGALPPGALTAVGDLPDPNAKAAELTRVSAIDPNRGPVTIWSVGRGEDVTGLYLIGHAEEACCRALTSVMNGLLVRPELDDAWSTFGFGAFRAGKRPGGPAVLGEARGQVARMIADDGVCHGQALLKEMTVDPLQTQGRLAQAGQQALARAKQEGRPVVAYFAGSGEPTLAPIFTPAKDGTLAALDFRLPRRAVPVPPKLLAGMTLGDAAEEVVALREHKRAIELAIATKQQREPLVFLHALGPVDEKHTAFGAHIKEKMAEDLQRLRAIEDERQRFCILAKEAPASLPVEPWRKQACETLRDELATMTASFVYSIKTFDDQTQASKAFEWKFFRTIEPNQGIARVYERLLAEVDDGRLQQRLAETDKFLKLAYQSNRGLRIDPVDAARLIIDAALRGWPATFIDDETEHAFDAWNAQHQGALWDMAFAAMQRRGVTWAQGGDNPLLTSTLLFRVVDTGEALKVEPIHVLGHDFYMIADPDSNTVRFEATTTEQNLRGS